MLNVTISLLTDSLLTAYEEDAELQAEYGSSQDYLQSVVMRLDAYEGTLTYEEQLRNLIDGTSALAEVINSEPTSITSSQLVFGDTTDGLIISGLSLSGVSDINELTEAQQNALLNGLFDSITLYDAGDVILRVTTDADDYVVTSGDMTLRVSGNLPTSFEDLVSLGDGLIALADGELGPDDVSDLVSTIGAFDLDRVTLMEGGDTLIRFVAASDAITLEIGGLSIELQGTFPTSNVGQFIETLDTVLSQEDIDLSVVPDLALTGLVITAADGTELVNAQGNIETEDDTYSVTFTAEGTEGREAVDVYSVDGGTIVYNLNGGDDDAFLDYYWYYVLEDVKDDEVPSIEINGGAGRDVLRVDGYFQPEAALTYSFFTGEFTASAEVFDFVLSSLMPVSYTAQTSGFEVLDVAYFHDVQIFGSSADETVVAESIETLSFSGGGGMDTFSLAGVHFDLNLVQTAATTFELRGAPGTTWVMTLTDVEQITYNDGFMARTVEILDFPALAMLINGDDAPGAHTGGELNDTINGFGGNDTLAGRGGDDLAYGGTGNDSIYGGTGNDTGYGGDGDDLLGGFTGDDALYGGNGADEVWGAQGDDTLGGNAGNDTLGGAAGDDSLDGGAGNDELWGAAGDDTGLGGEGNDTLGGADGDDSLSGGAGNDELWGALGEDTLEGDAGNDTLGGFLGDDVLSGGDGDDELWGADGNDSLSGGADADTLGAGNGDDTLDGGTGNDEVYGGRGDDVMAGGTGNDTLAAFDGDDTLGGGLGDDLLFGGRGADVFEFVGGNDTIGGYNTADDALLLDQALWGGGLTAAQVLADFADDSTGTVIFDFTGGNTLTLTGISDKSDLDGELAFL